MTAVLSAGIPVAPRVSCCCVDVTRDPDDVSPEPELEPTELFPISSIRWTISVKSGKDHLPARSALAGKSNWKELPVFDLIDNEIVEVTGYSGEATLMLCKIQVPIANVCNFS
jgi:hypothetical protein